MARSGTGVTREGWRLLWSTLLLQRRQLLTGVAVGLSWTLAKVAVPQLTRLAIDKGIISSTVSVPVADLTLTGLIHVFSGLTMKVSASQMLEV